MDYATEQEMEIEALEAILMDDLQKCDEEVPSDWLDYGQPHSVAIHSGEDQASSANYAIELVFAHTPEYPEARPLYQLHSMRGLSEIDMDKARSVVESEIDTNLGMSMIYNIVSALKEWLQSKEQDGPTIDPEEERRKAEEEEVARRAAARAHGHPVTVEAFNAWKARFDAELALQKEKLSENLKSEDKGLRVTGRQFFQREAASELGTEDGALSTDDEEAFNRDDDDLDYTDDDDEGLFEEYMAAKQPVQAAS